MTHDLMIPVGSLIGSPGKERPFEGEMTVRLRLGESVVDGPVRVVGTVNGLVDAVRAKFEATGQAKLSCTRCLTEWVAPISAIAEQYFRAVPDEDGYAIHDGQIDVSGPASDELALALPITPLCRPDCLGLCPTCGTDLNSEPCDGHGDETDSPFAVLKDLFDS
jgi:uncharacterized protein